MRLLVTGVPAYSPMTGSLSSGPAMKWSPASSPPDLDITDRGSCFQYFLPQHLPHLVINCAGYTNVDGRKPTSKRPGKSTPWGLEHSARSCRDLDIPLLEVKRIIFLTGNPAFPTGRRSPAAPQTSTAKPNWRGKAWRRGC